MTYADVIAAKAKAAPAVGFQARVDYPWLFPFQRHVVRWALSGGRRAIFEDTGLGKTRQELAFAHHVANHTSGRVLIVAPLAVAGQIAQEADNLGLPGVSFSRSVGSGRICVTNYDSLHLWSPEDFSGIVLDESSILKSFSGAKRKELTDFAASIPYRLAATATPSPNDTDELGNHAEWLGLGTRAEMLSRFFFNDSANTGTWVLKRHATRAFWDWVATWAITARLPSDIGDYDDAGYILPNLTIRSEVVECVEAPADGALFALDGVSATTIHVTKRKTIEARARRAAEIVASEPCESWLLWCDTQYEADAVTAKMPQAVEVSGAMKPEVKTERLLAFANPSPGDILLTKPKIAGFGLNWQRCARMIFVGGSYSYEAFYQAVRRCWRFGQTREVVCYVLMGFSEQVLWQTVTGKADRHDTQRQEMIAASKRVHANATHVQPPYNPTHTGHLPVWLNPEAP